MTDAYFSMDGHVAPLDRLLQICRKHDSFLMIDEAHSTGVFGKKGRGMTEHFGLFDKVDVVMGTLSKALGSVGGFIAGRALLRESLINSSRTFIYTTAPVPAASAAATESLRIIRSEPARRKKLWEGVKRLREGLGALGLDLMSSEGPIIPVFIGDTRKALRVEECMKKERIFAPVIRPPTVPSGTDRLRFSVTALHEREDFDRLLGVIRKMKDQI